MIPWTALSAICQTAVMIKLRIQRQHRPNVETLWDILQSHARSIKHSPCSRRTPARRWSLAHQHLVNAGLADEDKEWIHQKTGVRDAGRTSQHGLLESSTYNELMAHTYTNNFLLNQAPQMLQLPQPSTCFHPIHPVNHICSYTLWLIKATCPGSPLKCLSVPVTMKRKSPLCQKAQKGLLSAKYQGDILASITSFPLDEWTQQWQGPFPFIFI